MPRSSSSSPARRRAGVAGLGLVVSLVSIGLGVLLVEVALRLTPPAGPPEPRPLFAGHLPRNSLELRDFEYPEAKPPGHFRILVFGDSFTAAEGVSFDDSFPKRLERALNYRSPEGPVYEVLNFGISRRSTPEELRLARRMIPRFDADLVVFAYCLNDAEDWSDPDGVLAHRRRHAFEHFEEPGGALGFAYRHSALVRLATRRLYNARTHREHIRYYRGLYHPEYPGWKHTRRALRELGEVSRAGGFPAVVMIFPLYSWGLAPGDYPFQGIHARLRKVIREADLHLLDLLEVHRPYSPVRVEALPGVDAHPNEIGHRIAAEHLWKFLVERQLLPSPQTVEIRGQLPFPAATLAAPARRTKEPEAQPPG